MHSPCSTLNRNVSISCLTIPVNICHISLHVPGWHGYVILTVPAPTPYMSHYIFTIVTSSTGDLDFWPRPAYNTIRPSYMFNLLRVWLLRVCHFHFWGFGLFEVWPSAQPFSPAIYKRIFPSNFQEDFLHTLSREFFPYIFKAILYKFFHTFFPYWGWNRPIHLLLLGL